MTPTIRRLTPAIGAEIFDLTVDDSHDAHTADWLHHSLMEHQLLVLRGGHLSPGELASLARNLGSVGNDHHLYTTHPDADEVVVLDWSGDDKPDAAEWHADMTYRADPPVATALQAIVVPPVGGDTLWASMYSVHDSLPEGLRSELSELDAVHDMGSFRTPAYQGGGIDGLESALAQAGTAVHPIIATHPVTGRPYLNVSESFTRFVIGLSAPESARLLTMLFDAINRPEHHARVRWEPGTIAIWDNRSTQHYAVADYLPHRRVMHRVSVTHDRAALVTV